MKKLFSLVLLLSCCLVASAQKDTFSIYFDLGIAQLDATAMRTLDSLIYHDILAANKKLGIIGYADYVGSEEANVGLSERRAQNVKQYLNGMGITDSNIQMVVGKGEITRDGATDSRGIRTDRRVDIIPGGIPAPPPPKSTPPTTAAKPPTVVTPKIDLSKVTKNETIRLNNIFFLPGRHTIREESRRELIMLYQIMKQNPTLKIRIEGHICCLPPKTADGFDEDSEDFNLSTNRAKSIYDYLVSKGISKDRLDYIGFGPKKPLVYPEKTLQDEDMNRRVELRVIDK
jgi:outer membrane protein OmpA-like peptidoglycan-associated protein